jgi:four helix bundle protein
MADNVLRDKSYEFALKAVSLGYELIERREFILSKQFIRSATSIGANMEEAVGAYSKKEFHHKITISYKEARETKYWIRLLRDSKWIEENQAAKLLSDLEELLKMMGATIRTLKSQL